VGIDNKNNFHKSTAILKAKPLKKGITRDAALLLICAKSFFSLLQCANQVLKILTLNLGDFKGQNPLMLRDQKGRSPFHKGRGAGIDKIVNNYLPQFKYSYGYY